MSGEVSHITAPTLEVYKTVPAHAFDLLGVLNDSQARKSNRGDKGWPHRFTIEDIYTIIRRGDTYIGMVNGVPAASLRLVWEDPMIWGPDAGLDGKAGYIHRLGRADGFLGVGKQMVAWACERIADEGRDYARLDCNRNLMGYYKDLGFTALGISPFTDYPTVLHEQQVGDGISSSLPFEIELELFNAGRPALEDALV